MASSAAAPAAPPAPGARPLAPLLAVAGPASALAAGWAVAKGLIAVPTALLALVLAGALAVVIRTLAEPPAGGMPSLQQVQHLIRRRRAVFARDFTGAPLERSQLEAILEAARWAPTHKKTEPWRFVVLGGAAKSEFEALTVRLCQERLPEEKREAVVAKLTRKADKDWKSVACYIAICMKRHADQVPEWEEVAAVSCAVQNMWLAATAAGVSGYWSSWQEAARTAPEMLEFLGMEPGDTCLGFFVAGQAPQEKVDAIRASRRRLESVVEWRM